MNKKLKWVLISLGVLVLIVIVMKMMGGSGNDGMKVTTQKVIKTTIVETVTASGNIYPEVEVRISPDVAGEVTELNVEEGDSVKKGQVLARIFSDIYELQRDQAASQVNQSQATVANSNAALEALKASLDQAKLALDRNKTLYEQKVISKAEYENFEVTYRSALANYNAAKENIRSLQAGVQASRTGLTRANKDLSRTTLFAPMDGVISSLKIKKGERVAGNNFNVGTEMMTVADMSVLEVRVDVGENDIVKVSIGDSADVEVDAYNDRKFKGIVTQIASSTKSSGAAAAVSNEVTNYEVRIRLDYDSYKDLIDPAKPKKFPFRPGMNASAEIKTQRHENVLAVPIMAVTTRVKGSGQSMADKKKQEEAMQEANASAEQQTISDDNDQEVIAFVLQADGTVKKVPVKTGIQDIRHIEIISGLKEGDEVVSGPYTAVSQALKEGSKVTVVKEEELFK